MGGWVEQSLGQSPGGKCGGGRGWLGAVGRPHNPIPVVLCRFLGFSVRFHRFFPGGLGGCGTGGPPPAPLGIGYSGWEEGGGWASRKGVAVGSRGRLRALGAGGAVKTRGRFLKNRR